MDIPGIAVYVRKKVIISKAAAFVVMLALPLLGMSGDETIAIPDVEKTELKNGLRVFFIADSLPQTTIVASIKMGKLYEDAETAGQSALLARTLSIAGSKNYPRSSLHETVEAMGGRLSISSSWEQTVISLKVLSRFSEKAVAIVSDLLMHPNFNSDDFKTAQSLVIDDIKRSHDEPASIAFEKARYLIFNGKNYGAVATVDGVRSYILDDITGLWNNHVKAGNVLIGINSTIPLKTFRAMLEPRLGSMTGGEPLSYTVNAGEVRDSVKSKSGRIFLYPKDIPQATIVVGTIAPAVRDEGTYALSVMNYILGGGSFNSRLMNEIRVKRGLAYAVQSIMRFRYKTGVFLSYAQTENRSVGTVLDLMVKNINAMTTGYIRDDELRWAQEAINNSYIFNFDTSMNVLSRYLELEYNDLPRDYYHQYLGKINSVNQQEILHESKRVFDAGLVRVVVGKRELQKVLASYGEVIILPEKEL